MRKLIAVVNGTNQGLKQHAFLFLRNLKNQYKCKEVVKNNYGIKSQEITTEKKSG